MKTNIYVCLFLIRDWTQVKIIIEILLYSPNIDCKCAFCVCMQLCLETERVFFGRLWLFCNCSLFHTFSHTSLPIYIQNVVLVFKAVNGQLSSCLKMWPACRVILLKLQLIITEDTVQLHPFKTLFCQQVKFTEYHETN